MVLLSGGASALLAAPVPGITLEDKVATGRALMRAGVAIDGLNCVRKHLSRIKGGRLAAAAARTITLAISDVHGPIADDPSVIGSGPTVGDPTTFAEALAIVASVAGVCRRVVRRVSRAGRARRGARDGQARMTPRLSQARYEIIGNRTTALEGAAAAARALGYIVHVLPRRSWARRVTRRIAFVRDARRMASRCRRRARREVLRARGRRNDGDGHGRRSRRPQSGVRAGRRCRRSPSFGRPAVLASAGTDGIDGPTDAAGALVDSTTLERARRGGLDWESTLAGHDAYHFLRPLGDLVVWGPTGTNVGDVQMLLVA